MIKDRIIMLEAARRLGVVNDAIRKHTQGGFVPGRGWNTNPHREGARG
jgi:hypothetical protein